MKEWKLGDINKSLPFILPLLGVTDSGEYLDYMNSKTPYKMFFQGNNIVSSCFTNCFIGDDDLNIDNKICLLYKFSGSKEFADFETALSKHPLFEHTYDVDDFHVMFVFKVPTKYEEDYNLVVNEGKYSKTSKDYQKLCIKFFTHEFNKTSPIYCIFNKLEEAYQRSEKELGIEIPRNQEAKGKFEREIEYFQTKYKVNSAKNTLASINTTNNE